MLNEKENKKTSRQRKYSIDYGVELQVNDKWMYMLDMSRLVVVVQDEEIECKGENFISKYILDQQIETENDIFPHSDLKQV